MVWNPFTRRSRLVEAQRNLEAAEAKAAELRRHLIVSRDAIRCALNSPSISERTRDKLRAALGDVILGEEIVGGTIYAGKITATEITGNWLAPDHAENSADGSSQ